jgi:hypothetical protein
MSETTNTTAGSEAIEARRSRLERLGVYSERDRANETYRRKAFAGRLRVRLPIMRQYRAMERARRESESIKRHADSLSMRRFAIYWDRYKAIANRVQTAHKIRSPGKAASSHHRYRDRMNELLWSDPEYRALKERQLRVDERLDAIHKLRTSEWISSGVLVIDDRETRRAKVAMYRERRET